MLSGAPAGPKDAQPGFSGGDVGEKLGQGIDVTESVTRNVEFETPVKGPKQVHKLLPRPAGARPGVQKPPATGSGASEADLVQVIPLDVFHRVIGQSALPQKVKEYILTEIGTGNRFTAP